jgi:long-chain acyl-CoA synthetase
MPNCPQFVISYWAVLMTGAIVVNMNPLYTAEELRHLFADSGVTGVITYDATIPTIKILCQEFNVPTVIVTKLTDFMPIGKVSTPEELGLEPGWLHFSQILVTTERFAPPIVEIEADDPAVIQYTGGTTGLPKGAILTQYNITATAMTLYQWTVDKTERTPVENRRVFCTIPFFHVYGESCCIIWGTFANATMVILPRFDIDEVFNTINSFDTFLYWPAVPTMIQALFYNPRVKEVNWHRKFAYAGSGAAPASEELIKRCRNYDFNFYEGFGMSETGAMGISTPTCKPKPMSIGIPFPDVNIRLVDDEDNDVPLGETGEIWLKSPHVM